MINWARVSGALVTSNKETPNFELQSGPYIRRPYIRHTFLRKIGLLFFERPYIRHKIWGHVSVFPEFTGESTNFFYSFLSNIVKTTENCFKLWLTSKIIALHCGRRPYSRCWFFKILTKICNKDPIYGTLFAKKRLTSGPWVAIIAFPFYTSFSEISIQIKLFESRSFAVFRSNKILEGTCDHWLYMSEATQTEPHSKSNLSTISITVRVKNCKIAILNSCDCLS